MRKLTCRNTEVITSTVSSEEKSDGIENRFFLARVISIPESEEPLSEDATDGQPLLSQKLSDQSVEEVSKGLIEMENCIMNGDITCFNCEEATALSLSWIGGAVTTKKRFLTVDGSSVSSVKSVDLQLQLRDATFTCNKGFARLADAPGQDNIPQMRVLAGIVDLSFPSLLFF